MGIAMVVCDDILLKGSVKVQNVIFLLVGYM